MSNMVPFGEMEKMSSAIVKSGFYGFKSVEQVMAIMLVAQAENKHPATVVQEYDIIQGRPALKSQAILARFQLAGGKVRWNEVSRTKCSGTFTHESGGELTVEWTIEMARQAGLYRAGSGWEKFPEDMLRARVISRAVRSLYPACILGHYAVEEVADFDLPNRSSSTGKPPVVEIDVTPDTTGRFPLHIPGSDTPYAVCDTQADWMGEFEILFGKIVSSPKLSAEEKEAKMVALRHCNSGVMNTLPAADRAKMTAHISKMIKEEKKDGVHSEAGDGEPADKSQEGESGSA